MGRAQPSGGYLTVATQVDPAAFQNAFYAHQDYTLRNRLAQQAEAQRGIENERQNRLLAMDQERMDMARQQFDAQQRRQQKQDQIAATDRQIDIFRTQLAPFSQRAIASGRPRAFVAAALADPAFQPIFREAGFDLAKIDVNSPDFMPTLEAIASMGGGVGEAVNPYGKVNPGDFTPQSLAAYAQTVDPRTGVGDFRLLERTWAPPSVSVQQIGGAPTLVDPSNRLGGGQTQPLSTPQAERDAAAATAGAEASARALATNAANMRQQQQQNDRSLAVYQTAMKGVSDALEASTTGPVAGRFPAFTASQQTAEGAVAAIAPALKQLFRASGEGTFTDRDQQLLLDMVPKRTDRPEARRAKIANINAIVAAKLGNTGGTSDGWSVEVVQ